MDGSQPNDVKTWDHADSYTLLYLSLRDVFGLFGDCVEMFDVVVQRKNPEHGFALLCTKASLRHHVKGSPVFLTLDIAMF